MAVSKFSSAFKIKVVAFCFTFILLISYEHWPKRSIELFPDMTQHITESVDSDVGGQSKLIWLDKESFHWVCELKSGALYTYCGIAIAWSDAPFKVLDLSTFDHLEMGLKYKGAAKYIRVSVRNFYPFGEGKETINNAKFNSISKVTSEFDSLVSVPLNDLRVADWWIDDNQIPPDKIKPDVSQAVAIGIDLPYPTTLGRHEFNLESLRVVGHVVTKEALYLTVILFWAVLLLAEMLHSQLKLRLKLQHDEQQLKELKVKSAIYQEKAEHDRLTGVLNREGLNRLIDELHSTKLLHQYMLLVIDLDLFKQVNDQYGHVTGDIVLQETAKVLQSSIRSYDLVARWGGEEFVILFYCLDPEQLILFGEKVRAAIESTSFVGGKVSKLTASIGATEINQLEPFENAFVRADKALYKAKETGRNKTIVDL